MIRSEGTEVDQPWSSLTPDVIEAIPAGPTAAERRASPWAMLARVNDTRAGEAFEAHGVVSGTDPYGATAVIASEAAARLAVDGAPAGVLAPSMAFDAADFLRSLEPHGVRWRVVRTAPGTY